MPRNKLKLVEKDEYQYEVWVEGVWIGYLQELPPKSIGRSRWRFVSIIEGLEGRIFDSMGEARNYFKNEDFDQFL